MKYVTKYCLLFAIFVTGVAIAEPPKSWKSTSVAIECKSKDIRDVFGNISVLHGIDLKIDEGVSGACYGWIKHGSIIEFLNSVSSNYGLSWYFFNNTLYISEEKNFIVERISITAELQAALKRLKLIELKYGWSFLKDAEQVLVNGPQSYITNVKSLISSENKKTTSKKSPIAKKKNVVKKKTPEENVFIISIEHASVVDREIDIRGETLTIPGIATVLNRLINGGTFSTGIEDTDPSALLKLSNKPGAGIRIEADVRTNSLVIWSPDYPESFFTDIIDDLDKQLNLIEIDAMIVDVNREMFNEIGVRYGIQSLRNAESISIDPTNGVTGNVSAVLNIGNYARFFADLRLLEGRGEANIVANTSILTIENQPALIDLSDTFYIRSVTENVASVTPVTTGTLLNITPQLLTMRDADGKHEVQLIVNVEDGKILDQVVDDIPVVSRSKINTKAIITAGKSLVIGGHRLQSSERSDKAVPVLGKIPFLKSFFTYKSTEIQNTERLFVITPRISSKSHEPVKKFKSDIRSYMKNDANGMLSLDTHKNYSKRQVQRAANMIQAILEEKDQEKGFRVVGYAEIGAHFSCLATGMSFEFYGLPSYTHDGISVFKVKATNQSQSVKTVPENSCTGQGLIAAANTGSRSIGAGESTFLLVAFDNLLL